MSQQEVLSDVERAQTYKVLAECYYPPDEALMALLAEVSQSATEFVREIARGAGDDSDLESLHVDHAKLFIGPYKMLAAPYGSVYLEDGRLMGNSTVDVKSLYAEEGLDTILKVAPDHIGVELEFMVYLIDKTIEGREGPNPDEAGCSEEKQRAFLARHLGQWVVAFAAKVEDAAETDFYRTLGSVTRRFMETEFTRLPLDVD